MAKRMAKIQRAGKNDAKRQSGPRLTAKSLGRPEGVSGEDTRARLLEVAATLFARQGYRGVSLSQIAGAAGLSAPAIYNYFGSKDDLFIETACDMYDEICEAFAQAAEGPGTWQEKVSRILVTCEELYREDEVLQQFGSVVGAEASRRPEEYARVFAARLQIDRIFQDIIEGAVEANDLPPSTNIKVTGDLLMSLIMNGIAGRTLTSPKKKDFKELISAFRLLLNIDVEPAQQTTSKRATVTRLPKRSAQR